MATSTPTTPPAIRRLLGGVDRRLRGVAAARGLGRAAVATAAGLGIASALDFALAIPDALRWLLWLAWTLPVLALLLGGVARPLLRPARPTGLAALVERSHPELAERLSVSVALAEQPGDGSPALRAALADDAARLAEPLDPRRIVPVGTARRWAIGGASALLAVALPALVRPDPFAAIASRALMPWSDVDRVGRFALTVRPGDAVVAAGDPLPVTAWVRDRLGSRGPGAVALEWADPNGKTRRAAMTRPERVATYAASLPGSAGSTRYRVVADGSPSRWHAVEAVEPPAVAALTIAVEPPAYAGESAATSADPARVEALRGSRIALTLRPSRAIARAAVSWPSRDEEGETSRIVDLKPTADGSAWTAALDALASGPFAFDLADARGLASRPEPARRLVVRDDGPPTIAIVGPDGPSESKSDDVLILEFDARDDLGLSAVELHHEARGEGEPRAGRRAIPLDRPGARRARQSVALPLASLNLRPGDVLAYRLRAADTLPPPEGPNEGWTSPRSLTIAATAESLAARRSAEARRRAAGPLDALKKAVAANRTATEGLRYAADAARRGNGAWDSARAAELARRAGEAADFVDRLGALADDLEAEPRFAPLAAPARRAAEVEADAAREALAEAVHDADPAERLADLQDADHRLAKLQERLDELGRGLDDLARRDEERGRLAAMAARQAALADRADEAAEAEAVGVEPVRAEQDALARELDDLTRTSPTLRAEALAGRARAAQALAAAARALAARQREEARATASLPRNLDDPRFRALAEAQTALEAGARRLALDADPTLSREGRGRLNLDPITRAIDRLAAGDVETARQRLEEAEAELRRVARELDEIPGDAKARARGLARRQEEVGRRLAEAPARPATAAAVAEIRAAAEALGRDSAPTSARPAHDAAIGALDRAALAIDGEADPRAVEARQNEAAGLLHRLADALPDVHRRRDPLRPRLNEARQKADEVARGLAHHLRETGPQPGRPVDPARADADLAGRLAPLAARQAEVVAAIEAATAEAGSAEPGLRNHMDRAARRAGTLQDMLNTFREAAAGPAASAGPRPIAAWQVVGPFAVAEPPPNPPARPIDPTATPRGRNGQVVSWRPVAGEGPHGAIDLARLFGRAGQDSAYASAVVDSEAAGPGRLLVGSDDTLTVWLDGQIVYEFGGGRAFGFPHASIDVTWAEGPNRLLVRCGNLGADWMFAVAAETPARHDPADRERRALAGRLRRDLPGAAAASRAAADRLDRKLNGRLPADDLAEELADDLKDLADRRPPDLADRLKATANALRNLDAPDADGPRAEAVRRIETAAGSGAEEDLAAAVDAAVALARSLIDREAAAPAIDPTPEAAAARELARRERRIGDALRAMLGGRAATQADLAAESAELARAAEALREATRQAGPHAQAAAQAAAEMLGRQVPPAMEGAVTALVQGKPEPALVNQRRAAELAELAAGRAEDLAAALRAEAGDRANSGRAGEGLAEARDAQRQAAGRLDQARDPAAEGRGEATREAAAAMRQAASALQAAARPSGPGEGDADPGATAGAGPSPGEGAEPADGAEPGDGDGDGAPQAGGAGPRPGPIAAADADLARLQEALKDRTGRAWGELPGHLRSELLQMSRGRYRDDYARLIQLYFREIAAAAGSDQKK